MSWWTPTYTLAHAAHSVGNKGPAVGIILQTLSHLEAPTLRAYRAHVETARYQSWDAASYADQLTGRRTAAKFCHYHQIFGAALGKWRDEKALRGYCLHLSLIVDESKRSGARVGGIRFTHVGDVGVSVSEAGKDAGFNVTLAPGKRGRGYARVGLSMALDWFFNAVPENHPNREVRPEHREQRAFDWIYASMTTVDRAHAVLDPRNTAAVNLFSKSGFTDEGEYARRTTTKATGPACVTTRFLVAIGYADGTPPYPWTVTSRMRRIPLKLLR